MDLPTFDRNDHAVISLAQSAALPVDLPAMIEDAREAVIGTALLAVTAFRMKDERGLVATMRQLTAAVSELEQLLPAGEDADDTEEGLTDEA